MTDSQILEFMSSLQLTAITLCYGQVTKTVLQTPTEYSALPPCLALVLCPSPLSRGGSDFAEKWLVNQAGGFPKTEATGCRAESFLFLKVSVTLKGN